jgi:hypothetical protein
MAVQLFSRIPVEQKVEPACGIKENTSQGVDGQGTLPVLSKQLKELEPAQ